MLSENTTFIFPQALTVGCETVDMTLRRNGLGQLGFHVRLDGTVSEVEEYGFAWQAGLRQDSRLVEICKVAAVTLTHDQMIDLLRTSVTVKVVIIPPFEEGGARRWASRNIFTSFVLQNNEIWVFMLMNLESSRFHQNWALCSFKICHYWVRFPILTPGWYSGYQWPIRCPGQPGPLCLCDNVMSNIRPATKSGYSVCSQYCSLCIPFSTSSICVFAGYTSMTVWIQIPSSISALLKTNLRNTLESYKACIERSAEHNLQNLCTAYEQKQNPELARQSASTFCFFLPPLRGVLISVMINTKMFGIQTCCWCSFLPEVFCTDSAGLVVPSCVHLSTRNRALPSVFGILYATDEWLWFLCCNYNRFDITETESKELFFSLFPLYVTRAHTYSSRFGDSRQTFQLSG